MAPPTGQPLPAAPPGKFPVVHWQRYEFVKLLGKGGMGAVYQARDPRLNRPIALKFIHSTDDQMILRFMQEARAQARIDHPGICKVYEVGEVEGKAYIAMQFIDGPSLNQAARQLSLGEKAQVIRDAAQALHAAHELGIIHRGPQTAELSKAFRWPPRARSSRGNCPEIANRPGPFFMKKECNLFLTADDMMRILPAPGLQDEVVSMLRITRSGSRPPRRVRLRSPRWLRATLIAAAALALLTSALPAWAAPAGDLLARHSPNAPSIPSPFLRLYSMAAFAVLAYLLQWLIAKRKDHRMAMRHGMAAGFVLSGIDHFLQAEAVYIPMLPDLLKPQGLVLVYISGVTELLGAVGLVVPLAVYRHFGLPSLRKLAGIGIALMLATLMLANVDIAIKAAHGHHYAFPVWTYYLRLAFQPVFILWALYATEVILAGPTADSVPMKLFLLDQHKRLERFFPVFKPLAMSYDASTVLREKVTSIVVPGAKVTDLTKCDLGFLFDYIVFPPEIMKFATEWKQHGRAMQKGDIIIQQASAPPLPLSLKMVFAVRIVDMFRTPTKVGFSYGTLKGHAEMGISEFSFSIQDGVVRANIHTYSAPGALLTRMVAPFITLPYQQYCTNRALQRMSETFLAANR